ncbi:MAG: co-chaperone GroES [Methanolobus sp.]|nr:co-chaperone GroES [Methanolobus sp.]
MEGNIKIRPLFDNVIVKKDELEEKSKTGIIITNTDENPALVGTVISVGKDVEEEIKPGDKIMYAPFSGRELGGFLILAQHDIMGVVIQEKEAKKEKFECTQCGTQGTPHVQEGFGHELFVAGERCPNCSNNKWKRI